MADHATKNTTTSNLPGLTGERVKAGVTIVVTLYALINAGLNLAGYNTLPFTNEQVSATVFSVVGVIGTIYGWWKNQNITRASLAGQQLVDALKKEGVVNGISAANCTCAIYQDINFTKNRNHLLHNAMNWFHTHQIGIYC